MRPDGRFGVLHVIVPEPPGEVGGADLHVVDLAVEQARSGQFSPAVLTVGSHEYVQRLVAASVPFVAVDSFRQLAHLARLRTLPLRAAVSVGHSHGYDADYLLAVLRFLFPRSWGRLPAVMTCHGLMEGSLLHRVKTRLNSLCFRCVDAVIVTSWAQRDRLAAWSRGPTVVIPNGVGTPPPARCSRTEFMQWFDLPRTGPLIATVGRLSPEKRIDVYLQACRRVLAERGDAHCLVVGAGRESGRLRSMVEEMGLTERITFTGLVADMESVYGAIDVLAVSSDSEGTPRVILEAMIRGIPVAATRVGGITEIISSESCGRLVEPGDAGALAHAILSLLGDPSGRAAVAAEGRRRASTLFTLPTMRERVERLYLEVLARKRASGHVDSEVELGT